MKRLEAITRTDAITPGLQARLADPLWLLGRQWQVGELSGEDAASPLLCTGRIEHAPATRLRAGQRMVALDAAAAPLEALVEREATPFGPQGVRTLGERTLHPDERDASLRRAAVAGRLLLRGVREALAAVVVAAALKTATDVEHNRLLAALTAATGFKGQLPIDPATRLLVRGSPSGHVARNLLQAVADVAQLYTVLGAPPAGTTEQLAAYRKLAAAALTAIDRWRRSLAAGPLAADLNAWDPADAAHAFRIDIGEDGPQLRARHHRGGRLDWYSVDFNGPERIADGPSTPQRTDFRAFPRSVRYPGMPASRFWEFEDARVDFGGWRGDPRETVRWLLAELAVVYGDDWFSIPVELPYGQLCRVDTLVIRDCFGGAESVRSFAAADGPGRPWRFLEVSGDIGPDNPDPGLRRSPWLWVAPVLAGRQEGAPIEELRLLRDETLDIAWGVELCLEGPDGRGRQRARRAEPPARGEPGTWTYHLTPPFPPGWTPLVLEELRDVDGARRYLRRGRLPGWTFDDLPRGRLLDATAPLRLTEAMLPPGGLVLTRSAQRTRGPDGRVWIWTGREVRPGAGPAAGDLQFDRLDRGKEPKP